MRDLTDEEYDLMFHAIGRSLKNKVPYRNHYVIGIGTEDDNIWEELENLGLAESKVYDLAYDTNTYHVTPLGMEVLRVEFKKRKPQPKWYRTAIRQGWIPPAGLIVK
jgi:hypothetical protein